MISLITQLKPKSIVFLAISLISLIILVVSSKNTAISGDEFRYIKQSENVYNYFASKGEDKTAIEKIGIDPQHYNSQSFDVILYVIEKKLDIQDSFRFRHGTNTLSGWLVILFAALIAIELFGINAGIITFVLLLASPRFIGHSFNNHRDIPLALSFVFTSYFIIKFLKKYPIISFKHAAFIVLGVASAYSLRLAGGILLSAFTIFFIGAYHLTQVPFKKLFNVKSALTIAKYAGMALLTVALAFALGILIWPFGLEAPIKNSLEVIKASSELGVSINQLFEGVIIRSNTIPWYYTPKYMLISTPLVVLVGVILYAVAIPFRKFKGYTTLQLIILIIAIMPLVYTAFKTKNDYGGWRHFIFIYPYWVIMASVGISTIIQIIKIKAVKITAILFLSILTLLPSIFIFINHPYQYVYYNELVGKVGKAYKNYESDYSCNGVYGGAVWIINHVIPELAKDEKITIVTNARAQLTDYLKEYKNQTNIVYSRYYEKSKKEWDYGVFYCGYITPEQLKNNLWPPKGTIHTESVDDFPIGAVVKRISDEDLKGFNAMKKNKIADAKRHFKNFLAVYPENEEVLEGYARAMLRERKYDSTIVYADSSIYYNPRQLGAWLLKASAYNTQKKYSKALEACTEMLKIKEGFAEGQFQKGFALKNLNKPNEALKAFQKATGYKKEYYQAHMQMGEILMNYKQYKKAINIYNQVFKFREKDIYATIYSAKSHHWLKNNIKAEELLKSLPARNKNNLEAVKVWCRIAFSKNDMNTAGRYLQMARNINNNADLFVLRALYVSKQNQKDLAKQYLDKVIELDPLNREAQELLKSLKPKPGKTTAQQKETEEKPVQQQSIMFQKPKPKQKNKFVVPSKK